MPDTPLFPTGTPMRIRKPDGSRLARPGFYPPNDVRHTTHLAGIVNSSDRMFYLGPDPSKAEVHIAGSCPDVEGEGGRIVYFHPTEAFLEDPAPSADA